MYYYFLIWNCLRQSVQPSSGSVSLLRSRGLAWCGAGVTVARGVFDLQGTMTGKPLLRTTQS